MQVDKPIMTNDVTKFGKALREIRLKKKMSQGDIARKLGVHRSYISGLERGKRNPSLLTIKKMAKAIGVEPKELLEYE
jgi:transcriptional regulator with XRE-family HTH domain